MASQGVLHAQVSATIRILVLQCNAMFIIRNCLKYIDAAVENIDAAVSGLTLCLLSEIGGLGPV